MHVRYKVVDAESCETNESSSNFRIKKRTIKNQYDSIFMYILFIFFAHFMDFFPVSHSKTRVKAGKERVNGEINNYRRIR